jgi:hypothetical protein
MTIDAVSRLELLVELFEQLASRPQACGALRLEGERDSGFSPPMAESRMETLTLEEILAETPTPLLAFGNSLHCKDQRLHGVVNRIARYLYENTGTINEDAPGTPRLLHYVYPVL